MDKKILQQTDPQSSNGDNLTAATPVSKNRVWKRCLLISISLLLLLSFAAMIIVGNRIAAIVPTTPDVEDMRRVQAARPSVLLSTDGTHLATFSQGQREPVTLERISPHVLDALIATEDHRFYDHYGIDVGRTLSAIFHTLRGDAQGGSTITQQLVRNIFPSEIGRSRTPERKLREIITAIKIERSSTKEEILETYLNSVPFLYDAVGIEMAARTYYGKSAADLNLLESATLVGMLKGTSYYNPVFNPERAIARRNVVLGQMVKHGKLPDDEFQALRRQPLQVKLNRPPNPLGTIAPHFAAHVRRQLMKWAKEQNYNIHADGLVVHSTLDDRLQQAAAESVDRQTEVLQAIADVEWGRRDEKVLSHAPAPYVSMQKKIEPFRYFWTERPTLLDDFVRESQAYRKSVAAGQPARTVLARLKADSDFMDQLRAAKSRLEAGFVAMDPQTGEVKAWIGSRSFERDQFDHVAQAVRQPGSTFKPLVYGAALELGFRPERAYPDGQVEIRTDDGSVWKPTDMSGFSHRMMSMREGLVYSKNSITAQVMQDVGLQQVINLARASGIQHSPLDPVPSLSLGTSPVTLLEMVSAYSTIASIGQYREPVLIRKITDRDGKVLAEFSSESERAMSDKTAIELIDMLRGVVQVGTGTGVRSQINFAADVAGKTGTTQNNTDGWFMLMHPQLVAGAWVGFNDPRVTMRSDHWGQGGHNAILLVGDFFRGLLKERMIDVKARFPQPRRPAPLMVKLPPQEGEDAASGSTEGPAPGYGVITRARGSTEIVGPGSVQTSDGRSDSPAGDDIGRLLTELEQESSAGNSSGSGVAGAAIESGSALPNDFPVSGR